MEKKIYDNINETLISEKLPNGLEIRIIPRPDYNKSYAMFATDYGGADRRFKLGDEWIDTPAGVAHFLEHKMFDMPDGNALNTLSANGASPNAFTGSGLTAYYFESTDLFYENLKVLLKFVSTPFFSAESVEKEQGIIGQEIRMVEDSSGYVMYNNLMRCLYKHNPVRDSVAGTVESIAQITDETLYKCHKVFYSPSNMALSVVGNVDPEKVIALARELLTETPGEKPERDYGSEQSSLPNCRKISAQMEVSAPQFLFGSVLTPASKGRELLKQYLTAKITLRTLFGRASPLYTSLYAEGLLNSSFEYEVDYTAGTAMIMCGGESRDISAVIQRLHEYVGSLIKDGINPDRFGKAKKAQFGSELRLMDSFSALAQALIFGCFNDLCPLDTFEILDEITLDDVTSFTSAHLTEEKIALSIISPLQA